MRGDPDWQRFATPLGFVRLILPVDWDPIGVLGTPLAMNEYDSYAAGVLGLLKSDADTERIVDHLYKIETQDMGIRGHRPPLYGVAAKLKDAYEQGNR